MKLRLEESDTVFQVDDIEPFPQTIADAILRMLAVAEAANPAIVQHEVLLELEYMRRGKEARDRRTKSTLAAPVSRSGIVDAPPPPAFVPVGPVIVDVPSDANGTRTFVVRDVAPNGTIVAMPADATIVERSEVKNAEGLPDGF